MIFETWRFDTGNPDDRLSGLRFFYRCPKCGSYHISKTPYDHLHPEALAGSAGLIYKCEDCGYAREHAYIMS